MCPSLRPTRKRRPDQPFGWNVSQPWPTMKIRLDFMVGVCTILNWSFLIVKKKTKKLARRLRRECYKDEEEKKSNKAST